MIKTTDQFGITWRDPKRAETLLNIFRKTKRLVLVTDYDGTLTPEAGGNWHNMRKVLPAAGQKIHKDLYELHIPLEKTGQLTDYKNRKWSASALDLHVEYGTKINDIQSAVNSSDLRPGAIDFIAACKDIGMLNIVVSAGVETPIQLASVKHGLQFDEVIAAKLQFNEQGVVIAWDPESLIIPGNKQEKLSLLLNSSISAEAEDLGFLVVGDKKHDANMVANDAGNLLRIMVGVDPTLDSEKIAEIWDAQFDGIVFGDDLFSLETLVRSLRD